MRGPNSYSGEDVVEINSHSGPFVLRKILEMVLSQGARIAEPGEFTRRAFLNGRLDLTQAEAVADIINAKSQSALDIAVSQLQGNLGNGIEKIRAFLQSLQVYLEADIDFAEDIEDDHIYKDPIWDQIYAEAIEPLEKTIGRFETGQLYREGLKVAVVGKPNVGKSSLLNRILEKDRAIVTEIPGTTRDVIEESLTVKGIPVVIIDTAGLRRTSDTVEKEGILKTRASIESADLVLLMLDAGRPVGPGDSHILKVIGERPKIIVINKIDLVDQLDSVKLPSGWKEFKRVGISAKYNIGIDALKEKFVEDLTSQTKAVDKRDDMIPNIRQKNNLEQCLRALNRLVDAKNRGVSAEFMVLELQEAVEMLGDVLGDTDRFDVIDRIFDRFCIGK